VQRRRATDDGCGDPPRCCRRSQAGKWSQITTWQKTFKFKDFEQALAFVNRVGEMAEAQWHHPDIDLAWGKVAIEIWTHKIDGLTESDFVFAAKCDALTAERTG